MAWQGQLAATPKALQGETVLGLAIGLCKGLGPLRVILSRFSGVSGFLRGGETMLGIAIGLCKGLGPLRVILSRFSGVSGFLRVLRVLRVTLPD